MEVSTLGSLSKIICSALFFASLSTATEDFVRIYQGTWKFVSDEAERLIIMRVNKHLEGLYYGIERAGEHGRYYYVVKVVNMNIDDKGYISFDIPARDFITEPANTLEKALQLAKHRDKNAGFARDVIHMKGYIENGYLVLECFSDSDSCYDNIMKFKRKK